MGAGMLKAGIFALVLTLANGESYVLDYQLTAEDCLERLQQFPIEALTAGAIKLDCFPHEQVKE
jgi:hypothetical protein